jgi:hypothetical protein
MFPTTVTRWRLTRVCREDALNEIRILASIKHRNIIRCAPDGRGAARGPAVSPPALLVGRCR